MITLTATDYFSYCEDYAGYCSWCNAITNESGVEPDAQEYKCDDCGKRTVMGIEEALIAGHIAFEDDGEEG